MVVAGIHWTPQWIKIHLPRHVIESNASCQHWETEEMVCYRMGARNLGF